MSTEKSKTGEDQSQSERKSQSSEKICMLIVLKSAKHSIIREGIYPAKVSSIKCKPSETNPKKILIGFKIKDQNVAVEKQLPASIESDTMLRMDVETILGRNLNDIEEKSGFDLNSLIDKECQVVVAHKPGAGGKKIPVASVIFAKAAITASQPAVA